jgi:hypothetical protein
MARTIGAKDLRKRTHRSDRGSKRKFYNGKPTKRRKRNLQGNFIPYKSKRGRYDPISIWFQEKKKMSYEGYRKWNPKLRKKLDKTVKPFVGKPVKVNPSSISTPEKIGEVAIQIIGYPGLFNFMMPSASKSSFRVSYKKKAVIKIVETEEGLHARVSNYSMMKHYWFFRKR